MKKRITCPVRGTLCELKYGEAPRPRILDATRCSLIEAAVDCDQECVWLLNIKRENERAIASLAGD